MPVNVLPAARALPFVDVTHRRGWHASLAPSALVLPPHSPSQPMSVAHHLTMRVACLQRAHQLTRCCEAAPPSSACLTQQRSPTALQSHVRMCPCGVCTVPSNRSMPTRWPTLLAWCRLQGGPHLRQPPQPPHSVVTGKGACNLHSLPPSARSESMCLPPCERCERSGGAVGVF
jgi:hypothetical protein